MLYYCIEIIFFHSHFIIHKHVLCNCTQKLIRFLRMKVMEMFDNLRKEVCCKNGYQPRTRIEPGLGSSVDDEDDGSTEQATTLSPYNQCLKILEYYFLRPNISYVSKN